MQTKIKKLIKFEWFIYKIKKNMKTSSFYVFGLLSGFILLIFFSYTNCQASQDDVSSFKQRTPTPTLTPTLPPPPTQPPYLTPTPSPTPTPSVSGGLGKVPIGNIDGMNNNSIWGWALDKDEPSRSIDVHVYKNFPFQVGGTAVTSLSTNVLRTDVNTTHSVSGNHGFNFTRLEDVDYYFYAIDNNGKNENPLIGKILTSKDHPPIGGIEKSGNSINGLAIDMDSPTKSLDIHIYKNGTYETGVFVGGIVTNLLRSDVNFIYGITGNHGFSYSPPGSGEYNFYAINSNGVGPNSFIGKISW